MSIKSRKFQKGVRTKPTTDAATLEGEQRTDSTDNKQKIYLDGSERAIVTEDQVQTLENKSIDADSNPISNLETDNLKAGVLNTDLSGPATDTEIPSALAVKTALDGQNEASEIDYDNTSSGLAATDVQAAIDEVETRVDTAESGLSDHLIDAVDAHDASAISNVPSGNLVATDVQGALDELQTEMDGRPTVTETMQNKTLDSTNTISGSIENPTRSDVKQDTEANLVTYAATATDGQFVFATDTQKAYQIIDNALEAIGGGGSTSFEISQTAHGLSVGNGIYHNGTIYVQAQADDADTLAYHVVIEVIDANTFIAADFGRIEVLAHGFTVGQYYFQSEAVAGSPVTTEPVSGYSNPLFYVEDTNTLQIKCLRPSPVGDSIDLDELADVSVPTPTDGQALIYDNGNARWEAKDIATSASDISYDNSSSGLTAVEAQSAIDEVEARVDTAETNIVSNDADIRDLDRIKNINYASNPDFNDDISGVTGDTNLIVSQETVSPLRGSGSLKIAKGAIDASTQSVTIDMDSVDTADLSEMMTISFDLDASHADYNDGDAQVRVIKDPSGTPSTIRVNGEDIKGGKHTHIAQFQTDATEVDYAVEIYWADTGTTATELLIDNVQVGPRAVTKGAAMTDWKEFTPTGSWNVNTTYTGKYRRVGDSAEVYVSILLTGSPNSTTLDVDLPNGLQIDIDKLNETYAGQTLIPFSEVTLLNEGTAKSSNSQVEYTNTTSVRPTQDYDGGGTRSNINATTPFTFANTDRIWMSFSVPIQGWSSNTILSEDIGNREIVVDARGNSGQTISGSYVEAVVFDTTYNDTTSSWNNDNTFIAPETGNYSISGQFQATAQISTVSVRAYVNGSEDKNLGFSQSSVVFPFAGVVSLNKGDELTIRVSDNLTLTGSELSNNISINKLANPQTILDTATVAARYTSDSGQSIGSTATNLEFEDIDFDTHNAYSTSTGVYTVPMTGYYSISASFATANTSYSAGNSIIIYLTIDEIINQRKLDRVSANITDSFNPTISAIVYLEKGQEVKIQGSSGVSTTMNTLEDFNIFNIARIK